MLSFIRRHSLFCACLCITFCSIFFVSASAMLQTAAAITIASIGLAFTLLSYCSFAVFLSAYRRTAAVCTLCSLLSILSCFYFCQYKNEPVRRLCQSDETHTVTAYATEASSDTAYGTTKITVTEIDGKRCDLDLILLRTDTYAPLPYRIFTAEVTFSEDEDILKYHRDENIAGCANLIALQTTSQKVHTVDSFFHGISYGIRNILHQNLNVKTAAFSSALLLGERSDLDSALQRDFKTLGISHTLAVSGLHLTILTGAVLFVLGLFRIKRTFRLIIAAIFILLFTGICGFSPSILRAALMSVSLMIADAAGKRTSGLQCLFLSLALILLFCPYLILSVSLQLSVLATLGILLFSRLLFPKGSQIKKDSLLYKTARFFLFQYTLTLSATLLTLPILYIQFRSISLLAFWANIVFIPLSTLFLYLLPLFLLLFPIPGIGWLLELGLETLYDLTQFTVSLAKYCKDFYCHLPIWILIAVMAAIPITVGIILVKKNRLYKLSALIFPLLLLLCYPASLSGQQRLAYCYDENQETLLLADQNEVVLIETGNASKKSISAALERTLDTLHQTGIDRVVLTHYHKSSASFIDYLCKSTYLDAVYLPEAESETDLTVQKEIEEVAAAHRVNVISYLPSQPLLVYRFRLQFHNEWLHRSDHPAQMIEIECRNGRILAADPAAFELDGMGAIDLAGLDHLILLNSPPMDKYPLPPFDLPENLHVLYANQNQFQTLGCPFDRYTVLTRQKSKAIIRFSS